MRLELEEEQHPGEADDALLGRRAHERSADTLGLPGRARRVVHDRARGPILGHGRGLAGLEVVVGPEAVNVADGEALLLREPDLVGGGRALVGEPLVGDEHLRLGVLDDVGDLGPDEVGVDRDEVEAGLQRGEVELEHLHAVREHHRHRVARLEARRT